MINFKEHFKLTGLYTFFAAFPAVLQLIVYPIIEGHDRLGAEDFGYLAIAEAILSFIVMISLYGMAITITRYYFEVKDDPEKYKRLVSTIFTGVIIRSVLVLGVIVILAGWIGTFFRSDALADFNRYGHYLAIIAFNRTVIMIALSLYKNEKKVRMFVIVSLLSGIARSIMQVTGVLYFDISFVGYLAGTSIGGGIAALFILIYTYSKCGFHYSTGVIASLSRYAFPLFIADIVFWGIMFIDRFLLMNDPEALGIYDNALKFAMGIQFVSQGLAGYVQPELYRLFHEGKDKHEDSIRSQSNLFMAENIAIITGLILPVMLFVTWFYETNLVISAGLLPLVFTKYIFYAQYQIFLWPIFYMKRTSVFLYVNIVVMIMVTGINIWLIPVYGYYGAIASSLAGGLLQVIWFYYVQQKVMPIKWNRTKVLWFPFIFVGVMLMTELFKAFLNMDIFTAALILTVFTFAFLAVMYHKELMAIARKYLFSRLR